MLEEPFRSAWKGQDIYELLRQMDGQVYRQKEGRRTFRFEYSGRSYFAKVFSGIGWKTLAACLLKFRRPFISAENEWRAVERLHQLGIPTMRVVGYGRRGRNPAKIESFIITEELKPTASLEEYCQDWLSNPPPPTVKRALVQRVAEIAKTLHDNGIIHRDLYICHFLLDMACAPLDDQGKLADLFLIDLHRATQNRQIRRRWRVKDVAGLYFSSMDIGLTGRDRLRFMSVYSGQNWRDTLQSQQRFWNQVQRRGKSVYREFRRKHPELFA